MDLGARSGCHSNVTDVKALFLLFHLLPYYFGRFACFLRQGLFFTFSFTSLLFRSFRLFRMRFGGFVSLFRVLVHAFKRRSDTTLITTEKRLKMCSKETSVLSSTLIVLFLIQTLRISGKQSLTCSIERNKSLCSKGLKYLLRPFATLE